MSTAETPQTVPQPVISRRTGKPTFWEDLIVTGFGFATSTAVAWLSWWMAAKWDFAVYTWMMWFVLPVGALLCGMAAATGYWIGARLFNHRPSRGLLFNIMLVSLSTFFAIHHFHYSNDKVDGRPVSSLMSFKDYLVAVTENMTYQIGGGSDTEEGMQLGKMGWAVAVLQVVGFSFGGFVVYGFLKGVPYCDLCAKYLGDKKTRVAKWKEAGALASAFNEVASLMEQGELQAAIDAHAILGGDRRLSVNAIQTLELRKCPGCERRRLLLTAQLRNGNQWNETARISVNTEEPLRIVV